MSSQEKRKYDRESSGQCTMSAEERERKEREAAGRCMRDSIAAGLQPCGRCRSRKIEVVVGGRAGEDGWNIRLTCKRCGATARTVMHTVFFDPEAMTGEPGPSTFIKL
jgi:hypothetical protein